MNDPRPLYRQLTSGRVGSAPVTTLSAVRRTSNEGAHELDEVRHRLRAVWYGAGARGAQNAFERCSAQLSAADADLGAAAELMDALAQEQVRITRTATPLIQWWCRAYVLFRIANPVLLELISAQVCTALTQLRAGHRHELARIAAGFDRLGGGGAEAAPVLSPAGGLPARGSAPAAVAQWWAGLSAAQRARLQAEHPDELAELTGLPPTVLDTVNRARIATERTKAQSALDQANDGLRRHGVAGLPDAMLLDNSDPAVRRLGREHALAQLRLDHANQTEAAVRSAQDRAAEKPPTGPVLLLKYRSTGAGGLAVSYGDPSTAHDVAVAVPGTSAGPASPGVGQADALRREMDRSDPSGSHAAVEWVDYDAPDSLTDTRVADPALAEEGAARLVDDVAGWQAAAGGDQHVTVVGHSYGSTLVGIAGQHGLAADDIAVVGSPGVGASAAAQLSAGDGHVWAGSAEHDPVVQVTQGDWFSADNSGIGPYDEAFGANQFAASTPLNQLGAHSEYYTPSSDSLHNLGAIATRDYDQVSPVDPDDTATAHGVLGSTVDGAQDVLTGSAHSVAELVTGHPSAAAHTAWDTTAEAVADRVDILANRIGGRVSLLGRFF